METVTLSTIALSFAIKVASSLAAKAIEKTASHLWGLKKPELEKRFKEATESACKEFIRNFPIGQAFDNPEIFNNFLESDSINIELEKIIYTDHDHPNLSTLYQAFIEAGFKEDMLREFDFNSAMNAFLDKFKEGIADIIEHRRNEEKGYLKQYLDQVAENCMELDFVGMPDLRDKKPICLNDVFITLHAREQMPENDVTIEDEIDDENKPEAEILKRQRETMQQRESAPVMLEEALKNNSKVVILGGPGSGKSTMLRYASLILAQENELDKTDTEIPIYLELSRFADRDNLQQSFLEFIYDYVNSTLNVSLPDGFFEKFLDQGKCILLLDGLDEVGTLGQRVEVKNIVSLLASRYSANKFVVTSRIAGYREASLSHDFLHFTICDLTPDDVKDFAHKWYVTKEGESKDAHDKADNLINAIGRNPRVSALASNPLMLTIIALIHRVEAELPNQRIKLYDKCTESLLHTWEVVKKRNDEYMSETEKRKRVEWIAYWMQDIPGSGERERTVRKSQIEQKLTEFLINRNKMAESEAEEEAESFINQIRRRTGVLVEKGREMYSFAHLTFQEYFSACYISRQAVKEGVNGLWEKEIKPRIHDPRWREVILLLMGKLNDEQDDVTPELVKRIRNADSSYEDILHRDLIIAGRCLADDIAVDESLKNEIIGSLFDLYWNGKYRSLINNVGAILTSMVGSKCESDVEQRLIKAMGDDDSDVRSRAASALGNLGKSSDDVVSALLKAMGDDKEWNVRYIAADALGRIGKSSDDVVSALLKAMGDDNVNVRYIAASALGQIGKSSGDVVSALIKAIGDNTKVRSSVASALGKIGKSSDDVVSALLKAMGDDNIDVRSRAASALGQIGKSSDDVVSALIKAMGDDNVSVRSSAASALGRIGKSSDDVVSALINAMGDDNVSVCSSAASALGNLGKSSDDVMKALLSRINIESDSNVADAIFNALSSLSAVEYKEFETVTRDK